MDRLTRNISYPYGISVALAVVNLAFFIGTPISWVLAGVSTVLYAYGLGYNRCSDAQ